MCSNQIANKLECLPRDTGKFSTNKVHKNGNEKKKPGRTCQLRLHLPPLFKLIIVAGVLSSNYLFLLVKTPIIFKSLSEVCKQNTLRNVKRDNRRRENTAILKYCKNA